LSIALLATDLVVAAWGHRHDHSATADGCGSAPQRHDSGETRHAHCHRADGAAADDEHRGGRSPADSHDDCSICRHISQPVAPASVELPQLESGRSMPAICSTIERTGTCLAAEHLARGPPASCA